MLSQYDPTGTKKSWSIRQSHESMRRKQEMIIEQFKKPRNWLQSCKSTGFIKSQLRNSFASIKNLIRKLKEKNTSRTKAVHHIGRFHRLRKNPSRIWWGKCGEISKHSWEGSAELYHISIFWIHFNYSLIKRTQIQYYVQLPTTIFPWVVQHLCSLAKLTYCHKYEKLGVSPYFMNDVWLMVAADAWTQREAGGSRLLQTSKTVIFVPVPMSSTPPRRTQ